MNMETSNILHINDFISNPGLRHIFKIIIYFLDEKSLKNCRLVSKNWHTVVSFNKKFWILQLNKCKILEWCCMIQRGGALILHLSVLDIYPEFSEVFDYFETQATITDLITFTSFMINYCLYHRKSMVTASPLHYAAYFDKIDVFELIAKSPLKNLNMEKQFILDSQELLTSVIGYACVTGKIQILEFYAKLEGDRKVDFGASDAQNGDYTPFHAACHSGQLEVVKFFLSMKNERNIDVNARAEYGVTPFMIACTTSNKNPEILQLLLQESSGINVNTKDDRGKTVLHKVCGTEYKNDKASSYDDSCRGKCTDATILEVLLNSSNQILDFNATDDEGRTPLHIACQKKCSIKVEMLLKFAIQKAINVNAVDSQGRTPAYFAFMEGIMGQIHDSEVWDHICR